MKPLIWLLPSLLIGVGCAPDDWGPEKLGAGIEDQKLPTLSTGIEVYANYCVGCHGENGDGEGPAARFLNPKPRDFRKGRIKFALVSAGEPPRDEDFIHVLDVGLTGTAMPKFAFLSDDQKRAVVAYIKTFYGEWDEDTPGAALAYGADPFADDRAAGVEEGRSVYHGLAQCFSCHPAYLPPTELAKTASAAGLPPPQLRATYDQSETKDSSWGAPIRPPDFLRDHLKTGFQVERVVRVVAAGIGGTAMPTWAGVLEEEQLWGLAYYVNDLALKRGTLEASAIKRQLAAERPKVEK